MVATVVPEKKPIPATLPQKKEDFPPPVAFLATPRPLAPINSGPTAYYANSKAAAFMWICLLVQLITRLVCCLWIATDDGIWTRAWFFCLLFGGLYLLSAVNIWAYKMAHFRSYMALSRYKRTTFKRSYIPYFFLLDQLLFFFLPIALAYLGFFLWKLFIFGVLIILLNFITFIIITKYEVAEHMPMKNQEHLIKSVQKEQTGAENNQLKIIESRAFKIVITNVSKQPVEGNLLIVRKVALKETIVIPLALASALHPRVQLTLIPEAHILPGAFQMKNFRSFGTDKGLIETKIYLAGMENYSIRMVEKFQEAEGA